MDFPSQIIGWRVRRFVLARIMFWRMELAGERPVGLPMAELPFLPCQSRWYSVNLLPLSNALLIAVSRRRARIRPVLLLLDSLLVAINRVDPLLFPKSLLLLVGKVSIRWGVRRIEVVVPCFATPHLYRKIDSRFPPFSLGIVIR